MNVADLAALAKVLEDNSDKLASESQARALQGWEESSALERAVIGMAAQRIDIPVKLDADLQAALKAGAADVTILLVQLIRLMRSMLETPNGPAKVQLVEEVKSGGATSQPAPIP